MTARDDVRRGRLDARADPRDADRGYADGPTLAQRLKEAREEKGVDLYRAERDTKIRAKYLAAIEAADWAELPGAVYTKGFLRNYAQYLGLDADDVIRQWRREKGDVAVPSEPVLAVPRPLEAPRQGITFSPVLIVAALLVVLIGFFALYIGIQLVRFTKPPTIAITTPSSAVVTVSEDATEYTLRGTSVAGATVSIKEAAQTEPYRVTAGTDGRWSADVSLRRGRNEFTISAVDPETRKVSEDELKVYITVPIAVVEAPTLTVSSPADGARFENGAVPVRGATTNAKTVTVVAEYTGPVKGQPASTEPKPGTTVSRTVEVGADGTFESPLELSTGRWQVTTTATSAEGKSTTLTSAVEISYKGVTLVVEIRNARAWLKVWVDGKVSKVTGSAGKVFSPGKVLTFTGRSRIEVRTGKSSATYFTLNGDRLGRLSTKGNPETWLFAPPDKPKQTNRS